MSGDLCLGRLPMGRDTRTFAFVIEGDDVTDLVGLLEETADDLDRLREAGKPPPEWWAVALANGAERWRDLAAAIRAQAGAAGWEDDG